jgi:hypothetical protein
MGGPVGQEPDDTDLEEELRRAVARLDGVPPPLFQAAVDSYTWRAVDAELAELVFDSVVDSGRAGAVRGPGQPRLLSFDADGLSIDVEVSGMGPARTLIGQIVPPQPASVEVRQGDEVTALDADELGRFRSGPLGSGPFRLACSVGTELARRRVATEWVAI